MGWQKSSSMDWLFKKTDRWKQFIIDYHLKILLERWNNNRAKNGGWQFNARIHSLPVHYFFAKDSFPICAVLSPLKSGTVAQSMKFFLLMLEDWQWVMELKLFNAAILDIITSKCNTSWGRIPLAGCIFERKIGCLRCLKTDHFVCARWHFVTDKNTMQNDNALTRPYIGGRLVKPKYPSVTRDT